MPLSQPVYGRPVSVLIGPDAPEAAAGHEINVIVNANFTASAIWPVANMSIGYPFSVSQPCTALSMWIYNGATAAGNLDLGIYDDAGTLLVSKGSTAQSGTNVLQLLDITDLALVAGKTYYMFAAMDGITGTAFRFATTVAGQLSALGYVQIASNFPLATGTFATMAQIYMPWFGLSRLATY